MRNSGVHLVKSIKKADDFPDGLQSQKADTVTVHGAVVWHTWAFKQEWRGIHCTAIAVYKSHKGLAALKDYKESAERSQEPTIMLKKMTLPALVDVYVVGYGSFYDPLYLCMAGRTNNNLQHHRDTSSRY